MRILGAVLERSGAPAPFAQSKPFTVGPLELDGPGPGEVLVRIEAAGVCHSDLSVVDGNRVRPTPMLLGHEAAGIVEALGDGVDDLADRRPRRHDVPAPLRRLPGVRDRRAAARAGWAARRTASGSLVGDGTGGSPATASPSTTTSACPRSPATRWSAARPSSGSTPTSRPRSRRCSAAPCSPAAARWSTPAVRARVTRVMVVGLGGVGMAALLVAVALGFEVIGVDALADKLDAARGQRGGGDLQRPPSWTACAPRSSSRPPATPARSRPRSRRPRRAARP